MSVDNTSTYSVGSVVTSSSSPVVRSQELNTLNSAFAAAFQASVAGKKIDNASGNASGIIVTKNQNKSATGVGTNIAIETLLRESAASKQTETVAGKEVHNKRNDNKNAETARLDNKQLDKTSLDQTEIRNAEIKADYINQLDRREQIRNDYLNRLNKREDQNKTTPISELAKKSPQNNDPPRQPHTTFNLNQTQTTTTNTTTTNKNNLAVSNHIQFLNVSNHRDVVREILGQGAAGCEKSPSEISVTIINSTVSASTESARQVAQSQQTAFTIFTPNGRIEQVEYDGEQNNNQQQNDENENREDEKEKKKNKKNNIEQSEYDNLSNDKSANNCNDKSNANCQTSGVESDILSDLCQEKKSADVKSELRSLGDVVDIFDDGVFDVRSVDDEIFDVFHLPEFIVTVLLEPIKFAGQIDFGKSASGKENELSGDAANGNVDVDVESGDWNNMEYFGWSDVSRRQRLMLRIVAACRSMANRNNTFRIKLNLDDAGNLFIRITKNKGNYSVSFIATNADTATKLNNGLDSLKKSLAKDNIKLDNINIDIENSDPKIKK